MLLDCDAGEKGTGGKLAGAVVLLLALWVAAGGAGHGQMPGSAVEPPQSPGGMPGSQRHEPDAGEQRLEHKQAERRNEERERELVEDTNKLLQLAQALQADVSKTNKNELSLDVMKRAEQIEKLAHSVREKMRGYY